MRLLTHVAQRIVNEVNQVLSEEVIVMNREGTIIAASDRSRIGSFHQGGKEVIMTEQKLLITEKETERLQGVKVGLNLPIRFQQKVIGAVGITGSKSGAALHGELIQRLTELIIEEAYAAEKLDSELRGLETFVYEWLHTETVTAELQDRGYILGIEMSEARYCVLLQLWQQQEEALEPGVEIDVLETIRSVFPNEQKDVLVRWGRGRFALLASAKQHSRHGLAQELVTLARKIKEKYHLGLRAGISRQQPDPLQMNLAYREAQQALAVKKAEEPIIFYDTFILEVVLAEAKPETRQHIIDKALGQLQAETELIETLQAYFAHQLSIKETATALHIHINTLHYRLKRIQELSGCQLKETKDLVALFIALWYYKEQSIR
ncbi:helix-turn-helix domain-containing protein [Alkalihalobacillus oceani]|uniref:Helix-turn-helix domain-containing protein n=1 Tax=Halalkalibacter oceani TaxID=1653776 RepID=A0A9X2IMV0_9BACI|nr:sugar diacid recognition domain-containing protein [Halalkalibacter oceani]MCM3712762.1 helix-turn-helix domain-containing protein [Halalkalibacter oceani]